MVRLAVQVLLLCLPICSAYPLQGAMRQEPPNMDFAQRYLEKYYNLDKNEKQMFKRKDSNPVVKKIQEMQKFLGLEMTGKLDSNTMDVMLKPRCGVPDVGGFSIFPDSPKWRKTHLTYRVENYTMDLPRESVDSAIEEALKVWEVVTPLRFSRLSEGEADIMISFAAGEHGDFYPFDGPGQSLAHAYPPGPGFYGDVHFDEDEKWTLGSSGINFFLVAAHELGHALGLFHSDKKESLMYPVYNFSRSPAQFRLSQDDIDGIQSLYGPHPYSGVTVVPTSSVSPRTEIPTKCDPSLSFDAVSTLRGELLFFKDRKGDLYSCTTLKQYQKNKGKALPFLLSQTPAVCTDCSRLPLPYCTKILTFKKVNDCRQKPVPFCAHCWKEKDCCSFVYYRYLWRLSRWNPEPEVHLISAFWPSLPSHLDAAYEANSKDSVFIFKGTQFWAVRGSEVQAGYPKSIHTLGFPLAVRKIDAAVSDKETKKTYFFVGDQYWRFDEKRWLMDKGFPRLIKDDFPGIEPQVDAVLQAFGFFYFFHGSSQFEFDPNAKMVTRTLKSNSWLLC